MGICSALPIEAKSSNACLVIPNTNANAKKIGSVSQLAIKRLISLEI